MENAQPPQCILEKSLLTYCCASVTDIGGKSIKWITNNSKKFVVTIRYLNKKKKRF